MLKKETVPKFSILTQPFVVCSFVSTYILLHKQFGNPQGYRLYVHKDSRSHSQWGFAYKKLPSGDVVIWGMTNMKLIR